MSSPLDDLFKAMRDGSSAFDAGMTISECPHSLYGELGERWVRGYNNAKYGHMLNERNLSTLPLDT